jgi:D-alanine-D-alanine ligase
MTRRVLHLVGSAVSDFYCDLSRMYAADCLAATADAARYETHVAYVTPDRRWRFPADLSSGAIAAAAPMPVADAAARLQALRIDVMVPQMFCVPGMTSYRALFDLLQIPYVGNRADVMALGAHKVKTRGVVASAGVRVPPGQMLRPGDRPAISPPAVVKPVDADNSLGVSLVRRPADYPAALENAFAHSGEALAERYIELGREVRCGIVARRGQLLCLPLEEYGVDAAAQPIRGYGDKLSRTTDGGLNLVAKDSSRAWIVEEADPVTAAVWEAARTCHVALGCRDYSLFDFRVDPAGQPWFLEAGLYCSFAPKSVIAMMAAAAGLGLDELFGTLIEQACPAPV